MMIGKWIPLSILLFFSILAAQLFLCLRESQEDRWLYQELKTSSTPESPSSQSRYAFQAREGVQKTIWDFSQTKPLRTKILSENSKLRFTFQDKGGSQVEEILSNVCCFIQQELFFQTKEGAELFLQPNGKLLAREKLPEQSSNWISPDWATLKPKQRLRVLETKEALYQYSTATFICDEVEVEDLIIEGHSLSTPFKNPEQLLKGSGEGVTLELSDKGTEFKAKKLRATFFSEREFL